MLTAAQNSELLQKTKLYNQVGNTKRRITVIHKCTDLVGTECVADNCYIKCNIQHTHILTGLYFGDLA